MTARSIRVVAFVAMGILAVQLRGKLRLPVSVALLGFFATWAVTNMPKKLISALLVFAIALVTVTPPKVFAQSLARPLAQPLAPTGTSLIEPNLLGPPVKPKSDLSKSFAAEVAKIKAGSLIL